MSERERERETESEGVFEDGVGPEKRVWVLPVKLCFACLEYGYNGGPGLIV